MGIQKNLVGLLPTTWRARAGVVALTDGAEIDLNQAIPDGSRGKTAAHKVAFCLNFRQKADASSLSRLPLPQGGRQAALEEINKFLLLRSDLNQNNMVVAGLDVAIDRLEMALRRWPATDGLRHRLR